MLRCLPKALEPGPRPRFASPAEVVTWISSIDWIVDGDRAIVLHLDSGGNLTCLASAHSRLQYIGPLARDEMAAEALACEAAVVVAVDVRQRLPAKGVNDTERRRHHGLRRHLAVHGVALVDTVIVSTHGGLSVTGALTYPLGGGLSWLQVHVPSHPPGQYGERQWVHEDAALFPARAPVLTRPALWGGGDPA